VLPRSLTRVAVHIKCGLPATQENPCGRASRPTFTIIGHSEVDMAALSKKKSAKAGVRKGKGHVRPTQEKRDDDIMGVSPRRAIFRRNRVNRIVDKR
jgi:hypothetical protein